MVASRSRSAAVAALAFGSGLCALVYQVAWLRELRLVFGASTPASAAVLAVFMGGLGFGGLALGRRAERSPLPLAFYGRLEMGAAVVAGISPLSILAARRLYIATGGSATLGAFGSAVVRLALTALVLGIATFLMGGTLPALGRAVTAAGDRGRRSLGWIYGCNTLGAVAGATLTTFLLLEAVGQRKSLVLAALVNLLVGMTAVSLARGWGPAGVGNGDEGGTEVEGETVAAAAATPARAAAPLPLVLSAAAVVGFVFFLMELVWYRLLAPLLGGTTYTFGIILMLALAGIGAGGLLYGALAPRRMPSLADFSWTCALEAFLVVVPLALSYRVALLTSALRSLGALGFDGLVLGWMGVGALVVLPASLVAGYQFPLLVALLGAGRREVAAQTGMVAAANTGGAIAGSLAGGFGLLPLLGAPGAWRLATVLLAALAAAAAVIAALRRSPSGRLLGSAGTAVAAALLCLLPGPGALWREGEIGAGRNPITADSPNDLRQRVLWEEAMVTWEEDGRESGVAVRGLNGLSFSINGKTDGHSRGDAETQVMAPLVGAMLHPDPQQGLVIGLGTGSSAGWLAAVPSIRHVDVVELEPAVVRVARDCAAVNHDALRNPKVELHIADGREFLLTRDQRWDVIVSEPSNPYRAGIASLFTTEFYRAAADRLAPNGIFVQWLQAYEVDAEVVASVYTSLTQVFPNVETWATGDADLLLIASATPVRHDLDRLRRRAAGEPFRQALAGAWGVGGAEGFYTGFVAVPSFARRLASGGAPPNVDDLPVIEFGFARSLGRSLFSLAQLRRTVPPAERRPPGLDGLDWQRVRELAVVRGLATSQEGPGMNSTIAAQARWLAERMRALGQSAPPESAATSPGRDSSPVATLLAAEELAEQGDARVVALARSLLPGHPVEAHALLARWCLRSGRRDAALGELVQSLVGYRRDPWPWPPLMRRVFDLADEAGRDPAAARRLLPALTEPFAVHLFEINRRLTRIILSERAGGGACRAAFHELEPYPLWVEPLLRQRAACYAEVGDPLAERAEADLRQYVDDRPATVGELLPRAAATLGRAP